MQGRRPVSALLAALILGQAWLPAGSFAGGAAVAPVRMSAPACPVTGYSGAALGARLTSGLGTRLTPLSAPLSGPVFSSLAAPTPAVSEVPPTVSEVPSAPSERTPVRTAPVPALPPTALPAPAVSEVPLVPAGRISIQPAPAASAAEAPQLQAEALAGEHGRFTEGAARVRADILSTLKALFYDKAAQAARAKEVEGIDPDWVKQMERKDRRLPENTKRKRGAVQKEGFTEAALDRALVARHNDSYTDELPVGPVADQQMSGRCWIFSGLNMIRSLLMSEGKVPRKFEFSANFPYFFSMLEKSNRAFENASSMVVARAKGRTISDRKFRDAAGLDTEENFSDGGYFEYFQFLVAKYGLVPKSAMEETDSSNNTELLNKELTLALAAGVEEMMARTRGMAPAAAAREAAAVKKLTMAKVWKILATHLGTPPESFKVRTEAKGKAQEFTPQRYARDFVGFHPEDYVSITSNPGQKEGAAYRVKRSAVGAARPGRQRFDLRYLNLGTDRLEQLALAALQGGQPVYFSSDANEDMDPDTGIMHPDIYKRARAYGLSRAQAKAKASKRFANFLKVAGPVHAMLITGFDRPDPGAPVVKFKVENSWGKAAGDRGVFHMYREWLRLNVYEIIVHKKFLSPAERKLWKGPAKSVSEKDIY